MKLFCHFDPRRGIDPATVLEALVQPLVEEYAATKNPPFEFQSHPDRIDVVWKDEVKIADVTYRPLVARIRVVKEGWPLLAYVWGLPVLSLADLISEYFSRASLNHDFPDSLLPGLRPVVRDVCGFRLEVAWGVSAGLPVWRPSDGAEVAMPAGNCGSIPA